MYNKTVLIGNLTKDITLTYLPTGSAVAKSSIATTHKYKSQSGEQKEEVCFLEFTIFGKGAEIANQYLKKGSKVLLEGRLIFEQWNAQDGTNRSKHSLRVDEMKMLDSKPTDNQGQTSSKNQEPDYRGNGYNENVPRKEPKIEYEQSNIPNIDIDEDLTEIPF